MDIAKKLLMQQLVKIIAPTSLAYGNGHNLPFIKDQSLEDVIKGLQVGDIIFTKTNNSLYEIGRRILGSKYDHVSVVISSHQVLHISPPIISKIQIEKIVQKSREPLIFRVDFLQKEGRDDFLSILSTYLGEKYNEIAIPTMFKNSFQIRLQKFLISLLSLEGSPKSKGYIFNLQDMKYSKICSQTILYALCRGHPLLKQALDDFVHTHTKYSQIGFIMPQELKQFLQQNQISIIHNGELERDRKQEKTALDYLEIRVEELMKKIDPLKSISQDFLTNFNKLTKLMLRIMGSNKTVPVATLMKLMKDFKIINQRPYMGPLLSLRIILFLITIKQTEKSHKEYLRMLLLLAESLMSLREHTWKSMQLMKLHKPKL